MEEVIEEESEDSGGFLEDEKVDDELLAVPEGGAVDPNSLSMRRQMSKEQKLREKTELQNLRTQMLEMKEEIARKTSKIETIRDTLKNNAVRVESGTTGKIVDVEASANDNEIDEAVREFEFAQDGSFDDMDNEAERDNNSDRQQFNDNGSLDNDSLGNMSAEEGDNYGEEGEEIRDTYF